MTEPNFPQNDDSPDPIPEYDRISEDHKQQTPNDSTTSENFEPVTPEKKSSEPTAPEKKPSDTVTSEEQPLPPVTTMSTMVQKGIQDNEYVVGDIKYNILSGDMALETLLQGKALENVYISELDFSSKHPHYVCDQRIIIKNSVLGNLLLGDTTFQKGVQFETVRLEKEVFITQNTHFEDILIFTNCTFIKPLLLRGVVLPRGLSTVNSDFEHNLSMEDCVFEDEVNFSRTSFAKKIMIRSCQFHKTLRLQNSAWKSGASFYLCEFSGNVRGDHITIHDGTQFKECRIMDDFYLEDITTKARIDFEKVECFGNFRWNRSILEDKFVVKGSEFHKSATWCNNIFKDHFALPSTRIHGELALDGSTFMDKVFIQECCAEDMSMRGNIFHDSLDAEKLHIGAQMLCQGTTFEGSVNFAYMESEGRGRISFNAVFCKSVDFYRATLRGPVWFLGTHFQDVCFVNTTFEGQVFFSFDTNTLRERNRRRKESAREQSLTFLARFQGITNFTNTLFYRKAVFENVIFEKFVNFENACFAEEINFQKTHFKKGATFKRSFCTQELDFTKSVFDEYVNFDLANINRRLNLTDAAIDQGISFYHAVIDVVVIEREQIEGRLIYEGTVNGQESKQHYMRVKEEYLILKESFHQRGKFDEEDWAYHSYRVNDRKSLTDKAWRSLLGRAILAVQDDVPPEERENDEALIQHAQKALEKATKNLESTKTRIAKLEEQIAAEIKDNQDHSATRNLKDRLEESKEKIKEQEETLQNRQKDLADTESIVRLNAERQTKLHESRDKPFGKIQAGKCLLSSILWKLVDWGTGYGVKPFRITLLALVVILAFAVIYHTSSAVLPTHAQMLDKNCLKVFLDWVYFSAMTFATSNLEGDIAFNDTIKFVIMSETLIGLFLTALFVGCYTRKIIR